MYTGSCQVLQVRLGHHLHLHPLPHPHLKQVRSTVKLDRGADDPVHSDEIPYDSPSEFCTYKPFDNQDRTYAVTNVQSDDIQYGGLNNSCNYINIDNLDTPSDLVRDSDIQSAYPNHSSLHTPLDNRDNSGETEINRNPPPLSNEAWTDIDTEFMNINQE